MKAVPASEWCSSDEHCPVLPTSTTRNRSAEGQPPAGKIASSSDLKI